MSKLTLAKHRSQNDEDFSFLARILGESGMPLRTSQVMTLNSYVTQRGRILSQVTESIGSFLDDKLTVDQQWVTLTGDIHGYNFQGNIDRSRFPFVAYEQMFGVYWKFEYVNLALGNLIFGYDVVRYP